MKAVWGRYSIIFMSIKGSWVQKKASLGNIGHRRLRQKLYYRWKGTFKSNKISQFRRNIQQLEIYIKQIAWPQKYLKQKKIGSKNKDLQPTIIMKVMYIASSLRLC